MTGAQNPLAGDGVGRHIRALWAASALSALAFLGVAVFVSADNSAEVPLIALTALLAAAAFVARALAVDSGRLGWLLLAGTIVSFGYTAALYLAEPDIVSDFPSAADVGAIGYLLGAGAFVIFARRELGGLTRALWLDATIGGLALAAVGVAIVHAGLSGGDNPSATELGQLLYLTADLMLAGFVFVAWGLGGFRVSTLLLLGCAAAMMGIADAIYTVRVFDGKIEWPPLLAGGWAVAFVSMGACAAMHHGRLERQRARRWSLVSVPVAAALVAVAIHLLDHEHSDIAAYLATAVLLLSVVRLAISLVDNQRAEARRRREAEERRAREEAERANRAKTEFLSRMSHEVRTPLNSILGFAQLLADDVDEAERSSVDRILRAGNHLRQLIDDILDLSSIEAGEIAIQLEPLELSAIIDESIALMEPIGRRSNVRIVRRDADDAPVTVIADAQRLKQSLLNLLSNAIKYGGSEAEVIVRVERDGEIARVAVIDSGPGIPAEHVPKLFTPFERGNARGSGIEGSGLGLALTKNLVEAMGGEIGLNTGSGGTAFHIDLPATETPESLLRVADARPTAAGDGHSIVLYIEDHLSNVALVERLLERREEYELLTATTGRAGLKLAGAVPPDVVLLDLDLPDIRGEDVLAELQAEAATAEIPVIVVSADATSWRQQELLRAGAAAYVVKPLQLESFLATLDGVVRRTVARS